MLLYKDSIKGEIYEYCVIYQELEELEYIDYDLARPKRKIIAIVDNEKIAKHFCKMSKGRYNYAYYRTDDSETKDYYLG